MLIRYVAKNIAYVVNVKVENMKHDLQEASIYFINVLEEQEITLNTLK